MEESNTPKFPDGMLIKAPHANAPEWVKGKLSVKRGQLIEWLSARNEDWINFNIKVSKGGKWYIEEDTWKPDASKSQQASTTKEDTFDPDNPTVPEEDLPF